MILINISEELAKTEGVDVKKTNLVFLGCVAAVVVLGVKIVGGLLTAALVVIPAAISRNFFGNLKAYTRASVIFGVVSAAIGVIFTKIFPFPAGPMIILVGTVFFIFSVFSKRAKKN
jgi:ABC-type Mn2+/Zn2+ transport system permease subunit